ncbi:hypothetical protein CRE_13308 [Caenorhabditis remanei]|uniref:F-box domain-containing protein n=1 Tax=Caenorhabditis remanei TaxID=31234 RepID=E3M846_CAERE|nr:hypothetical protein CRE_13308 [Caenorhabditis remanei]
MSSEFPLFRLPLIVLNHGLKLMTPFEILSLSLCSKRCNTVCQSLRNQLKCKEKAVKFQLKCSKKREIQLEFNYYPNTRWILSILQISENEEIGFSRNDLFVTNWIPTEEDTPLEQIREKNSMLNQYLKVYISRDYDDKFILRQYIDHLSYIFNITLTDLELHFQDFTRDENETIIDLYCGNRRNTNCVKALTLIGESENTPEDEEVVDHILSRQEAKSDLTLDILSSTFDIRRSQFRYIPNQLVIRNPNWVSSIDLKYFNSFSVLIFQYNPLMWWWHVEYLIEMWYFGWTPKWTVMMIEFPFINIDDTINKIRRRIPLQKKLFAMRSEETIEGPDGLSDRIKYSIPREDGTIGEFLVENNKYLYIKMRDNTELSLSTFITKTKTMM